MGKARDTNLTKPSENKTLCPICQKPKTSGDLISGALVRSSVAALIQKEHPDWNDSLKICHEDLNHYRTQLIEHVLLEEKGELSALDRQVIESIRAQENAAKNLNEDFTQNLTFGERLSDRIASFGGSWRFITIFGIVLFSWLVINIYLLSKPFDPFPFILLNLILSCIAAIQAPVIMMSQNRQEAKDRLRAEQDYRINLKAELEIRALHEKLDHILIQQWERMLEIQQMQIEILNELTTEKNK